MKATRYAPSAMLFAVGAIALIWGGLELYRTLTANRLERIVLENALGEGYGPEIFALRFVGIGLLALIAGWFDWRCKTHKSG